MAVHLAHATHIPFENLDILLGQPIRLDLESLQTKLVTRRGGYCFEQNILMAAALETLGFSLTRLAARVRYGTERILPRTHMALLVHFDAIDWLADVGFGAEGLLLPVPFRPGVEARQFAWTYRILDEEGVWTLQSLRGGKWTSLYAFSLEPQLPIDYEVANYYVSTHPESRFVKTLTVQRVAPEARRLLVNREYIVDDGKTTDRRTIASDEEILRLINEVFGLHLPLDTRFRIPTEPWPQ